MAERFAALAARESVMASPETVETSEDHHPDRKILSRRDLHDYLTRPGAVLSADQRSELHRNPALATDLDLMIEQIGQVTIQRAVAANSSELDLDRTAPPARVLLRPTARSDREVYLIVENSDRDPDFKPVRMIVNRGQGRVLTLDLPDSLEEPGQWVLPVDNELVRAVADTASTITFI